MITLNAKLVRHYTLALQLSHGKPVTAEKILAELHCSGPTLTRALKELRETYTAEIHYSKSTHSYQLINKGTLTPRTLRRMKDDLAEHAALKGHDENNGRHVILDKEKKRPVSLSLRMSVLRKISRVAIRLGGTRSEVVEMLVDRHIDDLMKFVQGELSDKAADAN